MANGNYILGGRFLFALIVRGCRRVWIWNWQWDYFNRNSPVWFVRRQSHVVQHPSSWTHSQFPSTWPR